MSGRKLLLLGDSWAWGTELLDPETFENPDWDFGIHFTEQNMKYRQQHRYAKKFADLAGFDTIIDKSWGGCSNDSIYRKLYRYLAENEYLFGRDPSDLFVVIGYTSPERKDFNFSTYKVPGWEDGWFTIYPLWRHDFGNGDLMKFHELYVTHLWTHREFMNRYIQQVFDTELMLKKLGIKYIMHQAFYQHNKQWFDNIQNWDSNEYRKDYLDTLLPYEVKMWDSIDPVRFMNKNSKDISTFYDYLIYKVGRQNIKNVIAESHPNELGHKMWGEYMYQYCLEHNLL